MKPLSLLRSLGGARPDAETDAARFRAWSEQVPDAVVCTDAAGRIGDFNPAAVRIFGHARSAALGQPLTLLLPTRFHSVEGAGFAWRTPAGEPVLPGHPIAVVGLHQDGREIPLELLLAEAAGPDGPLWVAVLRDLAPQQRQQAAWMASEERFAVLADSSAAAIFIFQDDRIVYANPAAARITGFSQQELVGRPFWEPVHPDSREQVQRRGQARLRGEPVISRYELKLLRKDGREVWADTTAAAFTLDGRPAGLVSAFDITERKLAEDAMRESERRISEILDSVQLVAVFLDTAGEVTFANPYLLELTGREEEEAVGQDWFASFVPEPLRDEARASYLRQLAAGAIAAHDESEIVGIEGERRLIAWTSTLLRSPEGAVVGAAALGADITERRRIEQRLLHDAFHDTLTGLPNRALFMDRLTLALARRRRRSDSLFGVLFVDLDRFKVINDSLGHAAGDQVLLQTSAALRGLMRPGDTVARLGGDEFAILLDDIDDAAAASAVAERIQSALSAPLVVMEQRIVVTASIGVALSDGSYTYADDLLRDADAAMYQAKAAGKARHQVFDASMHSKAVHLLKLENSLRRAVDAEEFLIHYQPIVTLADRRLVGFEALVRWEHPERGLVPPGDFVPLAEETGLILGLGRFVLRESCRWMHGLGEPGLGLAINVNLSSRQFSQPDLLEQIERILNETSLRPQQLKLEITESVIMENAESGIALLRRLKDLGTHVCIDDFGTGYSSLSYLVRFPADTLKIDRSFVMAMAHAERSREIVRTIVALGRGLGMDVVAEGVETEEQRALLVELGCGLGQGYLFSRPLDGERARGLVVGSGGREKPGEGSGMGGVGRGSLDH